MRNRRPTRRGVASVELAAVFLFVVVPLLIGVWEVGRLVQVQQVVANSAREGARLAAQGYTINGFASPTQIMVNSGSPNVHDSVYQYLYAAGLTNLQPSDVTVTFSYLAPRTVADAARAGPPRAARFQTRERPPTAAPPAAPEN